MSKKDSQCERLLKHLKAGCRINPLDSWAQLGIYRFSARIHDLKHQPRYGFPIIKERWVKVRNRWGEEFDVKEFYMDVDERHGVDDEQG